jgi:DNA-binding Lrp family transcriptional regulator
VKLEDETIIVSGPRLIGIADLLRKDFPEPKWAVPGLIPEGVSLIVGKPKVGKSWFVLGLGIAVASGGVALGSRPVEQGSVLYLALEDNERRLKRRCEKLLPEGITSNQLTFCTQWRRADDGGIEDLRNWLESTPDARLIIIDTAARIRPRRIGGSDSYADDYAVGEALLPLAHEYGVAVLVVHHTRKAESDDWMDEISGTTGLTGGMDGALVIKRARGDADAILHVTGRDIEDDADLALKWDQMTAIWSIVGDAADYMQTTARRKIIQAIRDAGRPLTGHEIADRLGEKYDNVRKVIPRLEDTGDIIRHGGNNRTGFAYGIPSIPYANNTNYPNKGSSEGLVGIDGTVGIWDRGGIGNMKDNHRALADAYRAAKDGE